DPVILLDAAAEAEGLIEVGDVVVGKIGDLLELDGAQLIEAGSQRRIHPLDPGPIIGLAFRALKALERPIHPPGPGVGAPEDAGRFARPAEQRIELGAANLAPAQNLDFGDVGRVNRKDTLNTLAVGDLAHRKTLVDAAARARDHHALIGLQAEAGTLGFLLG